VFNILYRVVVNLVIDLTSLEICLNLTIDLSLVPGVLGGNEQVFNEKPLYVLLSLVYVLQVQLNLLLLIVDNPVNRGHSFHLFDLPSHGREGADTHKLSEQTKNPFLLITTTVVSIAYSSGSSNDEVDGRCVNALNLSFLRQVSVILQLPSHPARFFSAVLSHPNSNPNARHYMEAKEKQYVSLDGHDNVLNYPFPTSGRYQP
jgi:hypothetical protein